MSCSCNKCHGKHSISLCLQKSENSETKADENNDKKNDVNATDQPTENSNAIVPTTPVTLVLKVTMFYYKQPVQKLPTKEDRL